MPQGILNQTGKCVFQVHLSFKISYFFLYFIKLRTQTLEQPFFNQDTGPRCSDGQVTIDGDSTRVLRN
jgi:hypothetical protein